MKKITLLFTMILLFAISWQVNSQSTIEITTSGGSYPTEKWVSITTAVDGGGTQVWGQGNGTQCDGSGLLTNEVVNLAPGNYYVNCYDQYDDSWDGTLISVTAYGNVIGDNGGVSPDDGADTDATSSCEGTPEELEASFMIVVPSPPACAQPVSLSVTTTSTTEATLNWSQGGSESNWTYEYGAVGYTQGTQTPVATTSTSAMLSGLTAGNQYDFYVQANCGGGNGDSTWAGPFTWTQPNIGDTCTTPLMATVEADCSTSTPLTIDFTTANDIGSAGSCDTTTGNIGAWIQFTTPASGALKITNSGANNEIVIYDACGGNEVYCAALGAELSLSGFTPNTVYYMAIWKDSFNTMTVDDFCLEEITCLFPTNLTATVTTTTDTDISWTPGNTPSEGAWEYVVQAAGTGVPAGSGTATNSNTVTVTGTNGTDYEFYVRANCGGSFSDWSGPVSWTQLLPPSNDDCANATLVDGALPFNETMDATAATNNAGFISDCSTGMNDGVWYTFTPIAGGTLDIAVSGVTGWDPELAIYSGSCGAFTCVDSADSGGTGSGETLTGVTVVAGTQYFINIGYWSGSTDSSEGPFTIDISTPDSVGLSVEKNTIVGFSLYPNPVNDRLQLNALDNINDISIYNLLGQEVLRTQPNVLNTEVDMTNLPTGMYVVKVKVGEQLGSYRIVKE